MREYIERTFSVSTIQWGEPDDDGESYAVVLHGEVIRASTPALLLSELQAHVLDFQVAA